MKKFLTIDWDYFIDCDVNQRNILFPDNGNENMPMSVQNTCWATHYALQPELKKVGLKEDQMQEIIKILKPYKDKVMNEYGMFRTWATDSHKWAFNYILCHTNPDETFVVTNIDFHHDRYTLASDEEEVNCGNWVNKIIEFRPNMIYNWVRRADSQCTSMLGMVECNNIYIEDFKSIEEPDYVFFCRSSVWTPPHLDSRFYEFVREAVWFCGTLDDPFTCRNLWKETKELKDVMKQIRKQDIQQPLDL